MDPKRPGGGALAVLKPGPEPVADLRREVPHRFTARQVNPDAGLVLPGRIGDHHNLVAVLKLIQEALTPGEDRTVQGRPEGRRRTGR